MLSKRPSLAVRMMSPSSTSKEELSAASGLKFAGGGGHTNTHTDRQIGHKSNRSWLRLRFFQTGIKRVRCHPTAMGGRRGEGKGGQTQAEALNLTADREVARPCHTRGHTIKSSFTLI